MKQHLISIDEVARLVLGAGFKGWRVAVIVAIVWAESGGDVYAIGINDHDPLSVSYLSLDRGLCQWNSYWQPHMTNPKCFTPEVTLAEMCKMTVGGFQSLALWNAFKSGAYLKHLPAANVAARAAGAY